MWEDGVDPIMEEIPITFLLEIRIRVKVVRL
jgi:hypothetical protein